jgi:tetratricopeptide (TPR) repeat protein
MKIKTLLFIGLLLFTACTTSTRKNAADSDIYLAIAREYLAAGETENVLLQVENAINSYPENFSAHFLKLETLAQAGRFEEAFKAADNGAGLLPPEMAYRKEHWLGVIYYHKNDLEKAAAYMENSSKTKPDYLDNHILLGQLYSKTGKPDKAIESYRRWTELEPESDLAWSQLGMSYVWHKKFDEAKKALDKALSINPENAVVYNYLGAWAMDQDRWEEAEQQLKKSIRLNDSISYANLNYAQLLMLRDRPGEAYPYLKKTYELDPGIAATLYWFGRYYYMEKEYEKAREYYIRAIEMDPAFWAARKEIADIYLELGRDYDRALSIMENGLTQDPGNRKGYYYYLAKLTLANEDPASALDYSEKAQALLKDSDATELSELNRLRGKIFEKLGQPEKARMEYKKVARTIN